MSARSTSTRASTDTRRPGAGVQDMQRRRLLLAIGEVVAGEGLESATVGRICGQAGVSRRTFYELFGDREDCLVAAFDDATSRIGAKMQHAYRTSGPWRERARAALTVLLEQLDTNPVRARLCLVESARGGPAILARRRAVLDRLAEVLDEGRAGVRARAQPPPLAAQGVVGGVLSVIHTRLLDHQTMAGRQAAASRQTAGRASANGDGAANRQPAASGRTATSGACPGPLLELVGPLAGMVVQPYLGAAAARRELEGPAPAVAAPSTLASADPFKDLPIRFTYRTACVLATIAEQGGRGHYPSNRDIADSAGIADNGQVSRLLHRLQECGLVENVGEGHARGGANAWRLSERGAAIHDAAIGVG
jgi:AcrR family transcriptional regulator